MKFFGISFYVKRLMLCTLSGAKLIKCFKVNIYHMYVIIIVALIYPHQRNSSSRTNCLFSFINSKLYLIMFFKTSIYTSLELTCMYILRYIKLKNLDSSCSLKVILPLSHFLVHVVTTHNLRKVV